MIVRRTGGNFVRSHAARSACPECAPVHQHQQCS